MDIVKLKTDLTIRPCGIAEMDKDWLMTCTLPQYLSVVKKWRLGENYIKFFDVSAKYGLPEMTVVRKVQINCRSAHALIERLAKMQPDAHDHMRIFNINHTAIVCYTIDVLDRLYEQFCTEAAGDLV